MDFTGKIGFCIGKDFERPKDRSLFERMKAMGSPSICDGLNKFNAMDPEIKPIIENICISGPAVTLRLRSADNLMMHKCLDYLRPGDVLVVDTCGCRNYSILGFLIATAAFKTGIEGIVIDGGIRDIAELKKAGYPIFARFVTPAVGDKDGPGEINMPISCGGVAVHPGDCIVADDNGVVVVPPDTAEAVVEGAEKKLKYEEKRMIEIESGVIVKPDINNTLRNKGIID